MVLNKEKVEEFEALARPLMKFLEDNFHPHVTVIVDSDHASLVEGCCSFRREG